MVFGFFKSAEIIGIKIPYSEEELNSAKKELIKKMNYKTYKKAEQLASRNALIKYGAIEDSD